MRSESLPTVCLIHLTSVQYVNISAFASCIYKLCTFFSEIADIVFLIVNMYKDLEYTERERVVSTCFHVHRR